MNRAIFTRQPHYPVKPIPYFLGIRPALVWLPSSLVDLSGNQFATNNGALGNVIRPWGNAISVAGSTTNGLVWGGRSTSATTRFTAASVFIWQSGAANNFPQLLATSTTNTGYRFGASATGTPGSTVTVGLVKGAIVALATITITADVPYFMITSHREDSGEYYILLKNLITNEVSRVTATNTSASLGGDGNYVVGTGRRDFSGSWNGAIGMAYMSLDFLPEVSAAKWLINPWQLFQPVRRRIFVGASTGTGPTYTLTAAQGSFTLTGQAAGLTASRLLTAAQGSYTLTGQAATLKAARLITAAQGSYTLTGQDATLTYTPAVTYTLTAAQGAFTLTGQAAGLTAARLLTAEQGTYSLTGIAAGLSVSKPGTTALVGDGYGLTYSQYQKLLARLKKKDASSPKTKYLWSSKHTRNCPKSGARPLQSKQHQCSRTRTASASMRLCLLERSRPFAPLWPNGSGISRTEKTKRLYC